MSDVGSRNLGRLGVYVDAPYRVAEGPEGTRVWADPVDHAFLLFSCEVGKRFERLVLFGRQRQQSAQELPLPQGVEVAPLPDYPSLAHLPAVLRAFGGSVRGLWRGLARVDLVWVFGPHPFALALVGLALLRRKRVVLGVRQDSVAYFRGRLPSRRWLPVLALVWSMDALYRLLGRMLPTTVVGAALVQRYGGERPSLLSMTVSVVRAAEVADGPAERSWEGRIKLLTVGRIEPEKNPLLLAEALAALERERPGRYCLAWIGQGRLAEPLRRRVAELGLTDGLALLGFVSPDAILEHYRSAHAFVHVSLTEGVPQVLVEALACGLPVVATDVGGVRTALDDGRAAVLVPPGDAGALVQAIKRLTDEAGLRRGLAERGLELARTLTLERQATRAASFLAGSETAPE